MIQRGSSGGETISPFLVIFTDLDGTLLDENTYLWEDARPALSKCKVLGIPIVITTSKTRAELEEIRKDLDLHDPFITENGGAIFFPKEKFPSAPAGAESVNNLWRWSLGVPYERLKKALREIAGELKINIKAFCDMDLEEIITYTGLNPHQGSQAAMREYDEPFLIEDLHNNQDKSLIEAASRRGLQVTKGDRFYHLHGLSDKGLAAKQLISWYEASFGRTYSIGIGDSPNDFPLLEIVDQAIFVGDPVLLSKSNIRIRNVVITQMKGPKGWNQGVLDLIKTHGGKG